MSLKPPPFFGRPLSALFWLMMLLAVVDLVLLVCSAAGAIGYSSRISWQLNLAYENNVAVWWSSATLFLAALFFFDAAFIHARQRSALLVIALLLVCLSLDEMGSLHERIFTGSYWSYVPYALGGGLLFLYAFWQLYKDDTFRNIAWVIVIGFSCFGSVVVQEFLEHNVNWPAWALGLRVGVEEGTELLGTALCLFAAGRLLGFDKSTAPQVPLNTPKANHAFLVVFALMLIAGVYAAVKAPQLTGYPVRGNPALWFAMTGFLYVVYEVLRGQELIAGIRNNLILICLCILASLAQTLFVFTRIELSLLVLVNMVLFVPIAYFIYRQAVDSKMVLFVFWPVMLVLCVLASLGVQGSAVATFMMSLLAAMALNVMQRCPSLSIARIKAFR